ncbi:polysaccharide pyruvyl transferase family protein [Rathayibacter sp. KR2-224]|uniref:polysaccharide pyruvyl transferase family protein n=1 Tax=Rathayibacter sp. KR2-224 TaxID=3400913 RepID=UPI003C09A908
MMQAAAGSKTRLGIWGVFGRGNFGNEATLTAFLERLDADVYEPVLFCEDPAVASALHGIPATSLGRPVEGRARSGLHRVLSAGLNRLHLLRGAISAARSVDVVVVAGTGGLERYGSGAFGTPFEIWALAKGSSLMRRPFVLLDIGVEVLPRRLARFFVRGAGSAASYRSYRDAVARSSMVVNGLHKAASDAVVTDLAFGLEPARSAAAEHPTVALGVMDYWGRDSSHETSEAVHKRYAAQLTALTREFQSRGYQVRLIGGDDGDLEFAHVLSAGLADGTPVVEARSPDELVAEMSSAHVVVASRYHTLIMALLAGTPSLSIGYADKHRAILDQLGLPGQHRDIESFDAHEVADAATALAAERTTWTERIDAAIDAARERLDQEWDQVARVLTPSRKAR